MRPHQELCFPVLLLDDERICTARVMACRFIHDMAGVCAQEADLKDGGDVCMHCLAFPYESAQPCTEAVHSVLEVRTASENPMLNVLNPDIVSSSATFQFSQPTSIFKFKFLVLLMHAFLDG